MTRQEIIDYCLTLSAAYEDYPFDEVVDDKACTVMRHKQNKKSFALIMLLLRTQTVGKLLSRIFAVMRC